MISELQWWKLFNLINGLPQIDWYVHQVEVTGDYLYVHVKNVFSLENASLFVINAEGDFI